MAAIINALFGTYPELEQQNIPTDLNQTVAQQNECLQTSAVVDDVHVKSVISSETQAHATLNTKLNIDALLAQLNTTHSQVDEYSRNRTVEINEQVQKSIAAVLENTKHQQEELLVDANRRHLIIDNEYKIQLQKAVEALDAAKAKSLADLERDLQEKQQLIMNEAKKQIDLLNDQANAAKLSALVEAQEHAKQDITNIAEQVAVIDQQGTEHVLQSTTTTIITSQAQTVDTVVTAPVTDTVVTTPIDNQLQVAVTSPTELVPVPTVPTTIQESTTVVETAPIVPDVTTTSVEPLATSVSTEVTSNTNTVIETVVQPSSDNTIVQ